MDEIKPVLSPENFEALHQDIDGLIKAIDHAILGNLKDAVYMLSLLTWLAIGWHGDFEYMNNSSHEIPIGPSIMTHLTYLFLTGFIAYVTRPDLYKGAKENAEKIIDKPNASYEKVLESFNDLRGFGNAADIEWVDSLLQSGKYEAFRHIFYDFFLFFEQRTDVFKKNTVLRDKIASHLKNDLKTIEIGWDVSSEPNKTRRVIHQVIKEMTGEDMRLEINQENLDRIKNNIASISYYDREGNRERVVGIVVSAKLEGQRLELAIRDKNNETQKLILSTEKFVSDGKPAIQYVVGTEVAFDVVIKDHSELNIEKDKAFTKGGIDLNAAMLDLQIKRDANGVALPMKFQNVQNINIDGFFPVIINITPVTSLPLLSELQKKEGQNPRSADGSSSPLKDLSYLNVKKSFLAKEMAT